MKLQLLLSNMLNKFTGAAITLDSNTSTNRGTPEFVQNIINPIFKVLDWLLPVIMIVLGIAGIIYSIVLGVNYAKAENADQKDAAKKRLINVVIGVLVMLIALVLIFIFIQNAYDIFDWVSDEASVSGAASS